ncbi:MAG: hypothetical protein ACREON_13730 [Gemmatimonadaceae bacterium]
MDGATVLILTRDILGAGLIGALVDGLGQVPCFPLEAERGDMAVRRLRPSVVILECFHAAARTESFFTAMQEHRVRLVLFAPSAPWEEFAELAERRGAAAFVFPQPGRSVADGLRDALTRIG